MNRFQELVDLCKGDVVVFANGHRPNYESIEEYVGDKRPDIPDDVWQKIIETGRIYSIQAYKNTPVGFYLIYHYDFELAIEELLKMVKEC